MKNFLLKSVVIFFVVLLVLAFRFVPSYHYDTFNVFHWKNRRFASFIDSNKNFIKTKYILNNPKKFNAFIFGSSRVGYIPSDVLPREIGETKLNWYNMTYNLGLTCENLMSLETFLKNDVDVKAVMVGFDEVDMFVPIEHHYKDLMTMQYQMYEEKGLAFYLPFLATKDDPAIVKEIKNYDYEAHKQETEDFYNYGWFGGPFLTENPKLDEYDVSEYWKTYHYTQKDAWKDLADLVDFCERNDIELILFTNPLYQKLYRHVVAEDYFDFLRNVAQKCEFYHFTTLNKYTKDARYFMDWSHYRPAMGLIITKYIFGTEDERAEIRRDAEDDLFGVKINFSNVDEIIERLNQQLQ